VKTQPASPFASLKTSEVMLRASSLLDVVADKDPASDIRALANELRLRARWIEVARHDTGVSQERRLAIAAIEDAPRR